MARAISAFAESLESRHLLSAGQPSSLYGPHISPALISYSNFNVADTSVGPAGSTSGLSPTGTIDSLGNAWSISNGVAVSQATPDQYFTSFALRPVSENVLNPLASISFIYDPSKAYVLVERYNPSAQTGFVGMMEGGHLQLRTLDGGGAWTAYRYTALALSPGTRYWLAESVQSVDATHVNFFDGIFTDANLTHAVGTELWKDLAGGPHTAGAIGFNGYIEQTQVMDFTTYDLGADSPLAGNLFASATTNSITATIAAATGGSNSYSYQWYSSASGPDFTLDGSTIDQGANGLTYTATSVPAGQRMYFRCLVTDANGQQDLSDPCSARTFVHTWNVALIGDSTTAGIPGDTAPSVGTIIGEDLRATGGPNLVNLVDGSVTGSTVQSWLPGSQNYTNLIDSINAASGSNWTVDISLGSADASDSLTTTQYAADIGAIANDLVSRGYQVLLSDIPSEINDGAHITANRNLRDMNTTLYGLADGVHIFRGASDLFAISSNDAADYEDAIDPGPSARALWAQTRAEALYGQLTGTNTSARALPASGLKLAFLGDSLTAGTTGDTGPNIGTLIGQDLRAIGGQASVTVVNAAVPGSTTGAWLPGTSNYQSLLNDIAQAGGGSGWVVEMEIGTNNVDNYNSLTTITSSVQTTASSLVALGDRVIISDIPSQQNTIDHAWDNSLYVELDSRLSSICDGVHIIRGADNLFDLAQTDTVNYEDGWLHPNSIARTLWAEARTQADFAVLSSPVSSQSAVWLDPSSQATWNASTQVLTVTGPTTIIHDPGIAEPQIVASGVAAVVTIAATVGPLVQVGSVNLMYGASMTVASLGANRSESNHTALVVGQGLATPAPTLSIDNLSTLDLQDNDLVYLYAPGSSPVGDISSQISSAYDGGKWDQSGITSSIAAANPKKYSLGVASSDTLGVASFDGVLVGSGAVIIKYTLVGDTDLNGSVDLADYTRVVLDLGKPHQIWSDGNFDYSGNVNLGDYTAVSLAIGSTMSSSITSSASASAKKH